MSNKKQKANQTKITVTAKNRPAKEQASIKLKRLGEFLSNNWQSKNENPLD